MPAADLKLPQIAGAGTEYPLEDWVSTRPRKFRRSSKRFAARAQSAAETMRESRDWSGAGPEHVVALYAWCHARVYQLEALELDGDNFFGAFQLAKSMLANHFGGDVERMVEFVHWTWARELDREKWRRENKRGGQRIGYRLQFSPSLLTDWRADELRRAGRQG